MDDQVLKCDYMVKRAQMKAKLLKSDNYKGRWFRLTKNWLYYCDGRLEVMLHVAHQQPLVAINFSSKWMICTFVYLCVCGCDNDG